MRNPLFQLMKRRGNAMIELGLILPALTGAVIFVSDVGAATYRNMTLKSAVHAGADYALRYGDIEGIRSTIAAAANRDLQSLQISSTQFCGCATTVVTCGGICNDGTSQQVYKTISVSEIYNPMFVSQSIVGAALGNGNVLQAQATYRIK